MMSFTQGNLLEADVDALVNTVNTVGVMGKGVALMFKEAYPDNFRAYASACRRNEVMLGSMFVYRRDALIGPKWIINFPTKDHWRSPSQVSWIIDGLIDLKRVIEANNIRSIAIPPLGAGNGGLDWKEVRPHIERIIGSLTDTRVMVYEPTAQYQNVAKRSGVEQLTPARALVTEIVRRYMELGISCTLLEVQKLAYFLQLSIVDLGLQNPLKLSFKADRFGPYAPQLRHLLEALDGSYLHCGKRLADAGPLDTIWFEGDRRRRVDVYLGSEAKAYRPALDRTSLLIDGFESPFGMELLATVDWLLRHQDAEPTVAGLRAALARWPGGPKAAQRKLRLFDDRSIDLALERLAAG